MTLAYGAGMSNFMTMVRRARRRPVAPGVGMASAR
jgi:hypothetical protein